jgi:hypothetical protein
VEFAGRLNFILLFWIPLHGFSEPQLNRVQMPERATALGFRTHLPMVRDIEQTNAMIGAGIGYSSEADEFRISSGQVFAIIRREVHFVAHRVS